MSKWDRAIKLGRQLYQAKIDVPDRDLLAPGIQLLIELGWRKAKEEAEATEHEHSA